MIMKRLGISFVLAAALTCVSCIYDFDPQVEDASQFVVVEGDILIGDYSYFRVSESRNLKDLNVFISRFTGTASVECDDGTSASARGSLTTSRNSSSSGFCSAKESFFAMKSHITSSQNPGEV